MTPKSKPIFDPKLFLAKVGQGRTIADYSKNQVVFSQSDRADAVWNEFFQRSSALARASESVA